VLRDTPAAKASARDILHIRLDAPLPAQIAVGRGTAVFVCGWCFCPTNRIRSLEFVVDGAPQPVMAHGMPRLDPFRELHPLGIGQDDNSSEDPLLLSYLSGFWGLVRLGPSAARRTECVLTLRATLDNAAVLSAELGRLRVETPPLPARVDADGDQLIAICMATYNPPADLLARQLESIRAQTLNNWVCLISDDCSRPEAFAALQAAVAGDPRFVLSRSPRRLGFYRNFDRALSMVPPEVDFVALSDQDDDWHPGKLETLLRELGAAQLVYSDARIVTRDGTVISDTYWSRRRNNHSEFTSLLVANVVTGAASLFRRELLDYALPFPPAQFAHYHDHWLALTALALGDIRFVPRPLYDYVQHGGASLGHATANRMPTLADRLGSLRTRSARERIRKWRMHYFVDVARLMQFATVLEMRCSEQMRPDKRRALRRFLASESSPLALANLLRRGVRELVGRPETLGAEWMLFGALTWRRMLEWTAQERPQPRLRLDAVPPTDLAPGPARSGSVGPTTVRTISEKIAPLQLEVRAGEPVRVNLLIPTIDLEHFFGGYIAKFNLGLRLTQAGVRVRIVTVDPVGPLPRSWRRRIETYGGLDGIFEAVEVAFGREQAPLAVNPADRFIATTWWTAHIAHEAIRSLPRESAAGRLPREFAAGEFPFLYLIQEYEPFTFPMGSYAALAQQSYALPHVGLFSSELLRDYFRRRRIGVFAGPDGEELSASFQNAITAVPPPSAAELAARRPRRLLFYARPEPHAARNLFELGVLALMQALSEGTLPSDWDLHGIGSQQGGAALPLPAGAVLELLPRAGQNAYAQTLREHDVGMALMYTPHPSLVPIEMASAGMLTVTNTFENKTREAMSEISSNLIAAAPTVQSIADALGEAVAGAPDFERRARGSAVRWSSDWRRSFDDALVAWLLRALSWPA
jgi:glycosyltransferase involved in cell wall biosynthesis